MRPLSFRARLALTMGALIAVIAAALSFYLPRKLEEEAIALISHKAETLAQLTAFTIHPASLNQSLTRSRISLTSSTTITDR